MKMPKISSDINVASVSCIWSLIHCLLVQFSVFVAGEMGGKERERQTEGPDILLLHFRVEWSDVALLSSLVNLHIKCGDVCGISKSLWHHKYVYLKFIVYFHHCSDWDLFKSCQGTKKHDHVGLFVQVEEQQAQRKENLQNRGISTECFWTIASETNVRWRRLKPSIATVATLSGYISHISHTLPENAAWLTTRDRYPHVMQKIPYQFWSGHFIACVWYFPTITSLAEGPRRSPRCSSEWALRARKLATWIQVPTRLKWGQTWVKTVYF